MFGRLPSARVTQSVFARQVGSTLLGQVITLVLSMATAAITARWLGPGGRGQLAILLLVPSVMQLFLNLGIGVANVYYAGSGRLAVAQLTSNAAVFVMLGTVAGAVIALVLLLCKLLPALLPGIPTRYVLLGMAALPLGLASNALSTILQGLRRILTLNMLSVAQGLLTVISTAVFVIWLEMGVVGALAASLSVQAVILVAMASCVWREGARFRPRWDRHVVGLTLDYGLKGYVGNLLQSFTYRLDTFLVNFFVGPAGVGIYGAAVALAELLWQLPNAVGFVLFPKSASSSSETMNRFTPRVFWLVLAASSVGALALAVFGKLAIRLIYSGTFLEAYVPMLVLLPGVVLLGAGKTLTNDIAGRGYPHYNSMTAGLGLVVTLVLDLTLIPRMGALGAAIASTLAYASVCLLSVAFYLAVVRRAAGGLAAPQQASIRQQAGATRDETR